MSLASSRRGRPNNRRDSDADLAPNTIRVVGSFRSEIYASLGELPSGVFEILVDCVSSPDVGEFIELDDTLSIPDDTTIERGPIPVFKYQLFKNRTAMLGDGYVVLDDNSPVLDLNHARIASEQQIAEALGWERPARPKPAPVVYRQIPRTNDGTSYLNFTLAGNEHSAIKTAPGWSAVAFNTLVARVVGRLKVSLNFQPRSSDRLEVRIYDAFGNCHLRTEMTSAETRFDQTRNPSGDCLLVFRSAGTGALIGEGSWRHPNARVLGALPEKPSLDAILWQESDDKAEPAKCGVPRFEFSAC